MEVWVEVESVVAIVPSCYGYGLVATIDLYSLTFVFVDENEPRGPVSCWAGGGGSKNDSQDMKLKNDNAVNKVLHRPFMQARNI